MNKHDKLAGIVYYGFALYLEYKKLTHYLKHERSPFIFNNQRIYSESLIHNMCPNEEDLIKEFKTLKEATRAMRSSEKGKSGCVTKWFTPTKKRIIRNDLVQMTIPTNSVIHPLIRHVWRPTVALVSGARKGLPKGATSAA